MECVQVSLSRGYTRWFSPDLEEKAAKGVNSLTDVGRNKLKDTREARRTEHRLAKYAIRGYVERYRHL